MLKKLLKYDFRSLFKFWWIAAVFSFVLSILGGGCITLIRSERDLPEIVRVLSVLALVLVVFSFFAFSLASIIITAVRYYKNLFTDEGYLTFTLPVKRHQILNSKLITSVTVQLLTIFICVINVFIMLCIGLKDIIFRSETWDAISRLFGEISEVLGYFTPVYIIELLIFALLSVIFSTLFIYFCITFASVIAKKAKVLAAIGIYYAANSVFSFAMQIFMLFGVSSISSWLVSVPGEYITAIVAAILFALIIFFALICMLIYALVYWLMDRKLNLS